MVPSSDACSHVGRSVATPKRVLDSTASNDVEMVSYRAFKRGAKNGTYKNMYLTLV